MKVIKTIFEHVLVMHPTVFEDNRGHFYEAYNKKTFETLGIHDRFVQDNQSRSLIKGTIRGMHFQAPPMAQSKLIQVAIGAIYSVFVDLRQGSPTYLKWESIELSAANNLFLYLPEGFANGFCSLTDKTLVSYKVNNHYSPEHEQSFQWDDPTIGISWPTKDPILSDKDQQAPDFNEIRNSFQYGEKE